MNGEETRRLVSLEEGPMIGSLGASPGVKGGPWLNQIAKAIADNHGGVIDSVFVYEGKSKLAKFVSIVTCDSGLMYSYSGRGRKGKGKGKRKKHELRSSNNQYWICNICALEDYDEKEQKLKDASKVLLRPLPEKQKCSHFNQHFVRKHKSLLKQIQTDQDSEQLDSIKRKLRRNCGVSFEKQTKLKKNVFDAKRAHFLCAYWLMVRGRASNLVNDSEFSFQTNKSAVILTNTL